MAELKLSGFQNELNFTDSLNGKVYGTLSFNASLFLKQLYPDITDATKINADNVGGKGLKPDVKITVEGHPTNISLKKGTGNSVHQEKTSLFLLYCKEHLDMSPYTRNCFLAYLYGDGTLDGRGNMDDRLEGEELYNAYKEEIKEIQHFLDANKRPLLERFLIYGRMGKELNIKADYLYHGSIDNGVWCPLDEAVDYLTDISKTDANSNHSLSIGPLTIQTWNRGLNGNPATESRRHSMQVKWGNKLKERIIRINEAYLHKINANPNYRNQKLFGDNSHGFKNVKDIVQGLNNCRVRNISGPMLDLINSNFKSVALTDVVFCTQINKAKPDLKLTIRNKSVNVSVSMGTANSVHQEKFLEFVAFCKHELAMDENTERALRIVFYGDGTVDGTGRLEERIGRSSKIKKKFAAEVEVAQAFFDANRRMLAERFLIVGSDSGNHRADVLFHGSLQDGKSISFDAVLNYIEDFSGSKNGLLSIGPLSFQMWNRNIKGVPSIEYKRADIQIKWSSMTKGIEAARELAKQQTARSKIEGINAEYELVSVLNSDRSPANPLWKMLIDRLPELGNLTDIYAVRATHLVYSDFFEQKIYPKTDVYLCRARLEEAALIQNGYILDEDFLKENHISNEPILHSGISCKIKDSKSFTYSKMSINSFKKVFGNAFWGAGASLFVNHNDFKLNPSVAASWGIGEKEFMEFFNNHFDIQLCNTFSDYSLQDLKTIKAYCNAEIKNMILCEPNISDIIFSGKGVFLEPYNATFLFSEGTLKANEVPQSFSITTGSGRHKGKFTIVVKP